MCKPEQFKVGIKDSCYEWFLQVNPTCFDKTIGVIYFWLYFNNKSILKQEVYFSTLLKNNTPSVPKWLDTCGPEKDKPSYI